MLTSTVTTTFTETHLTRPSSAALDRILGDRFDVLDQGSIRVVDYMGTDASIVQAARVSYGAGTKKVREDRGLIRYLMRNVHTSPFEMCSIKLHVRVPMDTWRQWIRHRTASVNEYSTRYSEAIDANQKTDPDAWRLQSGRNKQGSDGVVLEWPAGYEYRDESNGANRDPGLYLTDREDELHQLSREIYEERLKFGVAREQARKDLPLSTYTEAYWTIDLHNLLHFLNLRMDAHAQKEIRECARVIGEIVESWVPMTWAAFRDYRLEAESFSAPELRSLGRLVMLRDNVEIAEMCEGMSKREIEEFIEKLDRLRFGR